MTWKLVKKACADNEEPINGYVLNEISQTTLKGVKHAETAADQLLRRIKKKEPNVKLKALHTTNFVCKNGSPYFKTRIRNNVETIKDCLTYTCPLDNVRGETPFLAVRTMAHNVLEILYEDNLNNDQNQVSNISSQPNTGFGNEPIKNKNKNTNQNQNQPVLSVIQPQNQTGQTMQTGLGNSPLRMNSKIHFILLFIVKLYFTYNKRKKLIKGFVLLDLKLN
ncbi:hypothetical protein M0813_07516 [Anaeramoeba flamelloides]|uniref:ENTH domain-containing protein n=1 Tax=Anaeramoeba flamelloides TaxID=1746091 RepID=A0ABQ8XAN6_9EUKA|nr:hypothetical protein M0813_07516 [Anaeramoeba flamelloides]